MNTGPGLSVGQRLAIGFAILLVVIAGLVGVTYYWTQRSAEAERAFRNRIVPLSSAAEALERGVLRLGIAARGYILVPRDEQLRTYRSALADARDALQSLARQPKDADGERLYRGMAPRVEAYFAQANEFVARSTDLRVEHGRAELALAAARNEAVGALHAFLDLQEQKTQEALGAIRDARRTGSRALGFAAACALVLFGLSALLTTRSIRRPARELLGIAEALREGDWQPALAWAPKPEQRPARDEMRRLAYAFGAAAEALERREQRLRADRELAAATASSLVKEDLAAAALHAACEHVRAEIGALYWVDEASGRLAPIALRALRGALPPLALGEGIPGRAAAEQRAVLVDDIPADSPFTVRLGYEALPPRSVAAVPIAFAGKVLGVLLAGSLRPLGREALAFLEEAAGQLSVGLQNVRTYEHVQQLLAELNDKNQQIQAQNEELQAQNEELQSQREEIQAQNEELQAQGEEILVQNEQLKQQADSLRSHAESLAEADRRKSEFLGVLAHELRNPMAAISNSLFALAAAADGAQRTRAQEVIRRQTRMLSRLVDDLLDVTRISNGKVRLQREAVELGAVVRECTEDYGETARKAGVQVEVSLPGAPVIVEGDRTRLCQIVGNLVDNAIKFCNGGRRVEVALAQREGGAELRVRDYGMGIEPAMLAQLFQPFRQADASLARRRSGLGLGLALTKALVELHHGAIEAHSEGPGKGAEFIVRLPLASRTPASAEGDAARGPALSPAGGRRVLIIEDNPDAAISLRTAMELAGHDVRIAYDALEGLEIAREFRPEVLLCDIGLPTMDGYQVARRFRSDELLRSTFLVAVTGYASPEDRERAISAGFDRHFGKPPDLDSLNEVLASLKSAERL